MALEVRRRSGVAAATALTLSLLVSGCSEEDSGQTPAPSTPTFTDSMPRATTNEEGDEGGMTSGPSTESPAGTAAEETSGNEAASSFPPVTRDDLLDALWEIADLEGARPEVDLVREVEDEEWLAVHVECMTASGFPPTNNNDQAVRWDVTAEQTDAFALAEFTCSAQYPRLMAYQQPYSTDQLTLIYDWMIEETIPCLAGEGHEVTDVVSLDAFLASYTPQGGFWTPEDGVPGGASFSALEACPHMPSQEVLFGG